MEQSKLEHEAELVSNREEISRLQDRCKKQVESLQTEEERTRDLNRKCDELTTTNEKLQEAVKDTNKKLV